MGVPLSRQVAEVRREMAMRKRLYPRWVREGRLEGVTACDRIATMAAVLQTLEQLQPGGRQPDIFEVEPYE